ncbi:MAG: GDSL-type esterase/lipase family protein [Planctomycetota bacterium]
MVFPHRQIMHRCAVRHDSRYGHAYVPGIDLRIPHERGCYFLRTNGSGFRADHEFGPRNGKPRIVVHGDSFAAGDGVSNEERFSDLVARALDVDVQNMAVSGYGPDQGLLRLEDRPPIDADLVLWCIAVHSIERIRAADRLTSDRQGRVVRVPRPRFELDGDELVLRGTPVPRAGEPIAEAIEALPPPLEHPVRCAVRSALAPALARVRRAAARAIDGIGGIKPDDAYADDESWALLSAIVRRFHARSDGVPVAIVPLPTAPYLTGGLRPTFQERFDSLALPESGLHVIDLVSALRTLPFRAREEFTYRRDLHYSPEGHAAVARVVADRIAALGLVPCRVPRGGSAAGGGRSAGGGRRLRLVVTWDGAGSRARLDADRRALARADEAELAGAVGHDGALPFAAINHCLEAAGVVGPELASITIESPPAPVDGARSDAVDGTALRAAAAWIRWTAAAERDLRALLRYRGPVDHRSRPPAYRDRTAANRESATDEEAIWLERELARLARRQRLRATDLARLARRWERRTRRARDAARP